MTQTSQVNALQLEGGGPSSSQVVNIESSDSVPGGVTSPLLRPEWLLIVLLVIAAFFLMRRKD